MKSKRRPHASRDESRANAFKIKSRRYVLDMQARLHFAAKTSTANIGDLKTAKMDWPP